MWLLEMLREYGWECLVASGELEATQYAHAAYYLRLAEEAEPEMGGSLQVVWLERLEREYDNLRAALLWSLDQGEHGREVALRLGGALRRFWFVRGHLSEGRTFLKRALLGSEGVAAPVRAKALITMARLTYGLDDYWAVASWYADGQGGQAFSSELTQVNPGDILVGVMTLTGQSTSPAGSLFNYNCQFQGIANSGLLIQNVPELIMAVETLEAYRITKCSDYPATDGMVFWQINIQTGSVIPMRNWTPTNMVTDCNQHAVVLSNTNAEGEVEIYIRPAGSLSLRNFLVTHGADPGQGVRKFIQTHYPGISSLRALLAL